ncbi:hypothetical protein [Streptomyces sp. NPDC006355]|uniref:hypothetical protein n=1 Tax=Streptomyces sp. NPDC006355 TaxID=3156758 RepID=UPI0033A49D78
MTTLHLTRAEVAGIQAGADGSVSIDLTVAGTRRLAEAGVRQAAILEQEGDRRAAWLRSLTNAELVDLARSRFGGPEPDVLAEATRRMREMADRLRPALAALRGAGVLEPESAGA